MKSLVKLNSDRPREAVLQIERPHQEYRSSMPNGPPSDATMELKISSGARIAASCFNIPIPPNSSPLWFCSPGRLYAYL
jgi:hypothetical protein